MKFIFKELMLFRLWNVKIHKRMIKEGSQEGSAGLVWIGIGSVALDLGFGCCRF